MLKEYGIQREANIIRRHTRPPCCSLSPLLWLYSPLKDLGRLTHGKFLDFIYTRGRSP
jgi:hypothetical protein